MKIDRLKTDLAKAKEKAAEWQARVRDAEKQITERENRPIEQVTRGVAASPAELRGLLDMIGGAKMPPAGNARTFENMDKEEI